MRLLKLLTLMGALLAPISAFAQTQQQVLNSIASNLPTNNANEISALALRQTLNFMTSAIFNPVGPSGSTTPTTDGSVTDITNNAVKTAKSIYCPFSVNGCDATTGGTEYDVGRFVLDLESVSGGTVSQANAVGAYAYCNNITGPYPGKGNCAALSGFTTLNKSTAAGWGIATNCQDNSTPAIYSGSNRTCFGAEFDVGIWDTSGTATGNGVLVSLQGGGTLAGTLIGYNLIADTASLKWSFGFNCTNSIVAIACINIGTQTTGVSGSQNLVFEYNFTGSSQKAMIVNTPSTGGFVFTTSDAAINNGFDWSAVTFNQCIFKILQGCIVGPTGILTTTNEIISSTINWSGGLSSTNQMLTVSGSVTGTATVNSIPTQVVGYWAPINLINITSDNLIAANVSTNTVDVPALGVVHKFGGNTSLGARSGIDINLELTSATGNSGQANYASFYNGIITSISADSDDGGTIGTPRGDIYGYSTQIALQSSVAHWAGVHSVGEFDLSIKCSTCITNKMGMEIALVAGDLSQGSNIDAATIFTNHGSVAWTYLFEIGGPSGGSFPVSSTGTIMGSPQGGNTNYGIDFSNISFTNCALSAGTSHAFCIKGNGHLGNVTIDGILTTGIATFGSSANSLGSGFTTWGNTGGGTYPGSAPTSAAIGDNFTGGSREVDFWNLDTTPSNPSFNFYQKTGTSAATLVMSVSSSGVITSAGHTFTAAAPTVAAAQIGLGSTTVAAGASNCPTGTVGGATVAGCMVINVAGTQRVVPFF